MGFRTVKINNRCKLETSLGYLVCRTDKETKILLDEISILIIENQQACITSALLAALMEHKVRVVICNDKHNPGGELVPYCSCYDTPAKIQKQLNWNEDIKDAVWQKIVKQKILNQALVLKYMKKDESYELLLKYYDEVTPGDTTNREGLAAKSYFVALFGNGFDRRSPKFEVNTYLDYGYSILCSAVNRSVSIYGYLSMVGIHHKGQQNPYNLGCDLMEPFRPFIDLAILNMDLNKDNFKRLLIDVLSTLVSYDDKNTIFDNAISFYVLDVLKALNSGDLMQIKELKFPND